MPWTFENGLTLRLSRWISLACALCACGGGTSYDGTTVRGPGANYRVDAPSGDWTALEVSDNHVAWRNQAQPSTVIQVNGNCDESLDIPLPALRAHLLVGFTERTVHSEELIELDGREALRTQLAAKLDGVERHLDLIVLKKNGCVYDFSLIAASRADFDAAQSDFAAVLATFRSES